MKTTPHTIFSRRTLALLVGIGLLAFAGTLVIAGFADLTSPQQRAGANSYSTSAIGHLAFVELIRTAGLPVVRSRSRSLAKAGPNDLLIVAEPPASTAESGEINYMMRAHSVRSNYSMCPASRRSCWLGRQKPEGQLRLAVTWVDRCDRGSRER